MSTRVLKGGRVVDPVNGRDGMFDVLIDGDRIARVGRDLPVESGTIVTEIPRGLVVCPGLIETPMSRRARLANLKRHVKDAEYDRTKAEAMRQVDRNQDQDVFLARRRLIDAESELLRRPPRL